MNPKPPTRARRLSAFTSNGRDGLSVAPVLFLLLAISVLGGGGLALAWHPVDGGAHAPTQTLAEPGRDTLLVFGPRRFEIARGESAFHVESFRVTHRPGARYRVVIENGQTDGSARAEWGRLTLNETEILSDAERLRSEDTILEAVGIEELNALTLELAGDVGSYVLVSVYQVGSPTTTIFGPVELIRTTGAPDENTWAFDVPGGVVAPFTLSVNNGFADGSARATAAWVELNGVEVFGTEDFGQAVGYLESEVALQDSANVVLLRIAGRKGSRIEAYITGVVSDTTAPVVTITAPAQGLITADDSVLVLGVAVDEGTVTVDVNGIAAQVVDDSLFSATVPLPIEGLNVITATATDAAGNQAVATTTVTRDNTAPALTVVQPTDSLVTNVTPTPLVGTAHDVNGSDVMVNGIPVVTDTTGAFSDPVALSEGLNVLTITATDPAGNQAAEVRTVILDTQAPVLTLTAPVDSLITGSPSVTVSGTVSDASAVTVVANGVNLPVDGSGAFSGTVALVEGANPITVTATDRAGNQSVATRTVTVDEAPPVLTVTAPADGLVTKVPLLTVSGSVTDASPVTVDVNGVPLPVDGAGLFSGDITLAGGANVLTVIASDAAGNSTQVVRIATLDSVPPVLTVTSPLDGSSTEADSVDVTGTVTDLTPTSVTLNGLPLPVDSAGAFAGRTALAIGPNALAFVATDDAGNGATVTISVERSDALPPDPQLVAPPLDPTVTSNIAAATEFLYTGADPIQTGVLPGTIEARRVSVLRGRVRTHAGQPLSGVNVTVVRHPEFGETLTRADGGYDIALNGGGPVSLDYSRAGYLSAQRHLEAPWQDYRVLDEVRLVPLDTTVTVINFSNPIQVARGSVQSDEAGMRQATVLFREGTGARMLLPDGDTVGLSALSFRATEYTVGPEGPGAMPAELPPATEYTYALELSADEALAAGAMRVDFDAPLPFYVENFLGLPVGHAMPLGYYDREKAAWVAEEDGIILRVVGLTAGMAELDITGDGVAESTATLMSELGIDETELQAVGALYGVGQSLWRARISHFTTYDLNVPAARRRACDVEGKCPPATPDPCFGAGCADAPDAAPGEDRDGDGKPDERQAKRDEGEEQKDVCKSNPGSYVVCQNQTLGERLAFAGTPFTLNYLSSRVPGWGPGRRLEIPIRVDSVAAGGQPLTQPSFVTVDVEVAGLAYADTVESVTQVYVFEWDGKDAYGRFVVGRQPVHVRIGFVYPASYLTSKRLTGGRSFGLPAGDSATATSAGDGTRLFAQSSEWDGFIGYPFAVSADGAGLQFGGWSLDAHHVYDPVTSTLYMGTGEQSGNRDVPMRIGTYAGNGSPDFTGHASDGQPAAGNPIGQAFSVLAGPDGSVYIGQGDGRIRRVAPSGVITTIAGGGTVEAEGVPALQARLSRARDMALGPDGSLYFVSDASHRAHRVAPDGRVYTVAGFPADSLAGTTHLGYSGDGGPAVSTNTRLYRPMGIAVAPDGTVYIAEFGNQLVRRVGTNGIISTYAHLPNLFDVALTPAGDLVMLSTSGSIVRKSVDGVESSVVGTGIERNGYLATQQGTAFPRALAVGPDGSIYLVQGLNNVIPSTLRVKVIQPNGIGRSIAGSGVYGDFGDGGPALRAGFGTPLGVSVGPDGTVYVADSEFFRIRHIEPPLEGFSGGDIAVASPDGAELFRFDAEGRHLETYDVATSVRTYAFGYDSIGFLTSIVDRDNLTTTISRDGTGTTTLSAPFGQTTVLAEGADGYLARVEGPEVQMHAFAYAAGGLLARQIGPRADTSAYVYDPDGRIVEARDAAGGVRTWDRSLLGGSFTVSETTALSRTTAYTVRRSSDGSVSSLVTDPAGLVSESERGASGSNVRRMPDGTVVSASDATELAEDVSGARTDTTRITLPSGLSSTMIRTRSRVVAERGDPLSRMRETETVRRAGTTGAWTTETVTDSALVRSTTPEGRQSVVRLGARGQIVEQALPGVSAVTYTYDALGRLNGLTQGTRTWQYTYDPLGRLATATDPLTRTTEFFYDAAGRLTRQVLPDEREVGYGYDAAGNLTSVTPSGRPAHTFQYGPVNLATEYRPPAVDTLDPATSYSYDLDRALTRVTRPDGLGVDLTYDGAGRAHQVTLPGGLLEYGYDAVTGNLTGINGPYGGALSMTYDGSLLTGMQWIGEVAGSVGAVYDAEFRVRELRVNGQVPVTFGYDGDGLLVQAGALGATRDGASGRLLGTTLGSVTTTQGYNAFGELASLSWTYGGAPLLATTYTRDALGRIETKTEVVGTDTTTWSYTYDPAGRLTDVAQNGVTVEGYGYDANGNRTSLTNAGGTVAASYDAQDRLLTYGTTSYTYTANGELAAKIAGADTTRYTYDVLGNLLRVELADGTEIGYVVDAVGRRIGRKVNGVLQRGWLYQDGLNPIAELDGAGNVVSRFVYGTRSNVPDYVVKGGTSYRIVSDELGSVRRVVDVATGVVAQELAYDAWGRVLVDTNPGWQPFGYAGGLYDAATGLVRFGARDYDAEVGRWTSKDPIGFGASDVNLYGYVGQDPVNLVDVTGLETGCPDWRDCVKRGWSLFNRGLLEFGVSFWERLGLSALGAWALGESLGISLPSFLHAPQPNVTLLSGLGLGKLMNPATIARLGLRAGGFVLSRAVLSLTAAQAWIVAICVWDPEFYSH